MTTTTKLTGRKIEITCSEDGRADYTVDGVLLDDGRLLTWSTGVDGGDSLWSRLEDYEANGLAVYTSHTLGDPCDVALSALWSGDVDNVEYAGVSVLTETEQAAARGSDDRQAERWSEHAPA